VDGTSRPHDTIEEMAAAYLSEVREVQAKGPYLLSGYCGGGVVAYEMAQQLLRVGEQVALLALIDSYRPGVELQRLTGAQRVAALKAGGPAYVVERGRARLARTLGQRIRNVRINHLLRAGRPIPYQLRAHWLMRSFFQSALHYAAAPIETPLVLLRARDVPAVLQCNDPDLGWRGLARQGLEVVELPGDHASMAQAPNVQFLAAAFDARLLG
jgi:thioesterase domain-containing protein